MAWAVAGVALLLALVTYSANRRLSRRVDQLTRSYWELRYEHGRLRSRLERLDPEEPAHGAPDPRAASESPMAFVPMSSLKRQ
jgi:hypothetical protein